MANQHFALELKESIAGAKWRRLSLTTISPEAIQVVEYVIQFAKDNQLNPDVVEARIVEIEAHQIGTKDKGFIRVVSHHPSAAQVNAKKAEESKPPMTDIQQAKKTAKFNLAQLGGALVMAAHGRCTVAQAITVATGLEEIDTALIQLKHEEENHTDVDHSETIKALCARAEDLIKSMGCTSLQVLFNDEIPRNENTRQPIGGRIRLEWIGSHWDSKNPLYIAVAEKQSIVWTT